MKEMDIQSLLKKAEELKALFVLGQRVIPFLEEIFKFFNEIKPLLDDINKSIVDNLQKMPKASKQLSKVTEATELASFIRIIIEFLIISTILKILILMKN
jgi:large-conductance mechanosensitive channel